MTVLDMIDNFNALEMLPIADMVMLRNGDAFIEHNTAQMMQGKRSDGRDIGDSPGKPYSSLSYAKHKQDKNPKAGFLNPDLNLTGSFQNNMYLSVKGETIIIDSADSKANNLQAKYGDSIYGLSDNSADDFVTNDLRPDFQTEIEKRTGLKFD